MGPKKKILVQRAATSRQGRQALKAKEREEDDQEDEEESSEEAASSTSTTLGLHPATDTTNRNSTTNTSGDSNTTRSSSRTNTNTTTGNINNNAIVNSAQADVGGIITRRRGRPSNPSTLTKIDNVPIGELSLAAEIEKKEEDDGDLEEEEDSLNKSSSSSEEGDIVIIRSVVPPRVEEESVEESASQGSNSSDQEEAVGIVGASGEEEAKSFAIVVNKDGSITFVPEDIDPSDLVPGQEKFNITLPKSKIKSDTNPFPGAIPVVHRSRKSKPEGATYGARDGLEEGLIVDAQDNFGGAGTSKSLAMSVGINQAHAVISTASVTVPIDIDEFTNQLDPQSLATLENLIQSQQAREIIENYDLQQVPVTLPFVGEDEGKAQKWNNDNAGSNVSESASSIAGGMSPSSSTENSPTGFRGRSRGSERTRQSTTSSRLSESDSNIRRSQRQQDRFEKQEVERIMAENQEMLKKEKEIMQGAQLTPKIVSPVPVRKVDTPHISPVGGTPKPAALVARTPSSVTSARDSIDSSGSDRKPYPKRENRRLPAHLADPNYISLEEEEPKSLSVNTDKSPVGRRPSVIKLVSDELEDYEEIHDVSAEDDQDLDYAEDYAEDDPNKLWCICQQPHNNRFMICCDHCEEWFHGKCVGVTKAQGKAMELKNILWVCPPCKKKENEKRKSDKAAERASHNSRRSSDVGKLSKSASAQQADAAAAAIASKAALTPKKTNLVQRDSRTDKLDSENGCVVCQKPTRKDSIYCSDQCVQKYAANVGSNATPSTSTNSSPTKLKRTNSAKVDAKTTEPIFNFHVISAGATKSVEVVPAKAKELTASQIIKTQKDGASVSPNSSQSTTKGQGSQLSVQGVSPNSVTAIISATPTVVVKKMTNSDGKSIVKLPGKISKDSPLKIESHLSTDKDKSPKTRSSTSDSKGKPLARKSDLSPSKTGKISDKMHRDNMRKCLREILKTRMKEMSEEEQRKINDGPYSTSSLAEKIEEELCKAYGGANNPKCKSKYRSIYFNLKDVKNLMYQELLTGSLKPRVLVKMEPTEMASAELAEWRQKESLKVLEAIKNSELDKIAESKKIELLEKGIDDAVTVAEELRPLDISDVIDQSVKEKETIVNEKEKLHTSISEKSKSSSHHGHSSSRRDRDKDSKSHDKDKRDKDTKRHKSGSSKDSSSSSHRRSSSHRGKEKEKVKYSDKHKKKELSHKETGAQNKVSSGSSSSTDEQSKSPAAVFVEKTVAEVVSPVTSPTSTVVLSEATPIPPKPSILETVEIPQSTDSEQELPSSTIKTPDFAEDVATKKELKPKHLFETKIVMPELGSFSASAHAVSHALVDGLYFPTSPVNIVGRIPPETVWDYINKMKKSKEVIVFRLLPATPADSEGYMTFFSYFSSRSRLGVMGGIVSPLKDVYLVPLPKQAPIPRSLLPFRGPGLPTERTHCLLAVVTRNIREPSAASATLAVKRKAPININVDQPVLSKKRTKLGEEESLKKDSQTSVEQDDDDDAPYTPWEEEESSSNSNNSDPAPLPQQEVKKPANVQRQLQLLEAKIAKEKQDIEKITGALAGRPNMSGIPGLDGEFAEGEGEESSASSTPPEMLAPKPDTSMSSDPRLRKRQRLAQKPDEPLILLPGASDVDMRTLKPVISPPTPEVMDISSEDSSVSSTKDEATIVKEVTGNKAEDSEEAYSPSGIPDEETLDSLGKQQTTIVPVITTPPLEPEAMVVSSTDVNVSSVPIPEVVKQIEEDDDVEPLPPGVDEDEPEPLPPGVDIEIPVKKIDEIAIPIIKPIEALRIDDIKITMPKMSEKPAAAATAAITQKAKQSNIDLDDNFPPTRPPVKKPEPKSDAIFESLIVPTPKVSPGATKMKININLTTKQLPSPDEIATSEDLQSLPHLLPVNTHLPPPNLIQPTLSMHQRPHESLSRPSPMPSLHIPPPPILTPNRGPSNSSVVINLNIPPPPLMPMMGRSMPTLSGPPRPMGFSQGMPFPQVPPPPPQGPIPPRSNAPQGFVPAFGGPPNQRPMPSGMDVDRDRRGDDVDRVQRVNIERDRDDRGMNNDRGGRGMNRPFRGGGRGRDSQGRGGHRPGGDRMNYGRRRFDRSRSRSPVERIRRRRSRTRSGDKSRSRSPNRRNRKRSSKSRSKSPLSRRWEARNRSRSPSGRRVAGGRNRSPSPKPLSTS